MRLLIPAWDNCFWHQSPYVLDAITWDKLLTERTWPILLASYTGDGLRWRHNEHDGVSNHQSHHCLLNRLFRRRSKETSKLRVTGLCAGNSPVTGEFPAQSASNEENVSIWWRHHGTHTFVLYFVALSRNTVWLKYIPDTYSLWRHEHLPDSSCHKVIMFLDILMQEGCYD